MALHQLTSIKIHTVFRERGFSVMHNVKLDFIPKPLDVGVRHGDQDVVPPRGPFDVIVLL